MYIDEFITTIKMLGYKQTDKINLSFKNKKEKIHKFIVFMPNGSIRIISENSDTIINTNSLEEIIEKLSGENP